MRRIAACVLLALALASSRAGADPEVVSSRAWSRSRLHAYAGLFGSAHLVAAQSTDYRQGYLGHGGGGGLFAGLRLNRLWSVEATWRATANREDFDEARVTNIPLEALAVTTVGLGARLYAPTDGAVEPYALASAGYAAIAATYVDCADCDRIFATGPAGELGAGIDLFVGRHLSIGARAAGQVIYFGEDAFEKRLRQEGDPSRIQTAIVSVATDFYAMVHF